jgi:hypothetical protein
VPHRNAAAIALAFILTVGYLAQAKSVAERRVVVAGYRLAQVLRTVAAL